MIEIKYSNYVIWTLITGLVCGLWGMYLGYNIINTNDQYLGEKVEVLNEAGGIETMRVAEKYQDLYTTQYTLRTGKKGIYEVCLDKPCGVVITENQLKRYLKR